MDKVLDKRMMDSHLIMNLKTQLLCQMEQFTQVSGEME
jgi:hypothetical protein